MIREAKAQDLKAVDALRRQNQESVGFLPMSRYEAEVGRGTLLVCEENAEIVGYLFWTKGRPVAAIQQTVIREDARRFERGQALVEAAVVRMQRWGSAGVRCRCRLDLEANLFWPAVGFEQLMISEGEGRRGPVAIYYRSLSPALFAPQFFLPVAPFGRLAVIRKGFRIGHAP